MSHEVWSTTISHDKPEQSLPELIEDLEGARARGDLALSVSSYFEQALTRITPPLSLSLSGVMPEMPHDKVSDKPPAARTRSEGSVTQVLRFLSQRLLVKGSPQ